MSGDGGRSFDNGTIEFVGYRVQDVRFGNDVMEQFRYRFTGPWEFFFEQKTFEQQRMVRRDGVDAPEYTTDVTLGQKIDGTRLSVGEQITEIVNLVIAQTVAEYNVPKLQFADTFPTVYAAFDRINNATCADALRRLLVKLGPNSIYFDYSTTPPTLHIKTKAQLQPATIALTPPLHDIEITRRDDLVPVAIYHKYSITSEFNGQSFTVMKDDIACDAGHTDEAGNTPAGLVNNYGRRFGVRPIELSFQGSYTQVVAARLTTAPFNVENLNYWKSKCIELANVDVAASGLSNANCTFIGPILNSSAMNLPYELIDGQIAPWMDVAYEEVTFTATIGYKTNDGKVNRMNGVKMQIKIKTTNAGSGQQSKRLSFTPGEPLPFGLSKFIYDLEKVPQFDGSFSIQQHECGGETVGLGNVLNLSGGRAEWLTMNAQIQRRGRQLETGLTTYKIGVAEHLGEAEIIERQRVERGMRGVNFNLNSRGSSQANNGEIALGDTFPKASAGAADSAYKALVITASDKTAELETHKINLDASLLEALTTLAKMTKGLEIRPRLFPVSVKQADGSCLACQAIFLAGPITKTSDGSDVVTGVPPTK